MDMAKYIKTEKEEPENPVINKAAAPAYEDSMGLTEKKLNWGFWYIEHLKQLKKARLIALVVISLLAWGYFFYGFLHYIFVGMKEDQLLVDNSVKVTVASHGYFENSQPKDLILGEVQVMNNGSAGSYDFVIEAENPNPRHWAEIEYSFTSNGEETQIARGFILPKEKKFFTVLSQDLNSFPAGAALNIKSIGWHPIKAKEISDWDKYYSARFNFEVKDIEFNPGGKTILSEKENLDKVEFAVTNNTTYNYWNVDFLILLLQGSRVASVTRYSQDSFMSGQTYKESVSWPSTVSYSSEIKVIPELNILAKDIYIDYQGEPSTDDLKRE